MTSTLRIKIETLDVWGSRVVEAMKEAQAGRLRASPHSISFPTYAAMHEALTPARQDILKALAGQGPLAIREVARRVGRDVQQDITRLINAGVVEHDDSGGVRFDYDSLQFSFVVGSAD